MLATGRIGTPRLVEADFGFSAPFDPRQRLYDPAQGGGALLDLGIYPLQLCSFVLGPVETAVALGVVGETGVDETTAAVLRHTDGGIGVVKASIRTNLSCRARITGDAGHVDLPAFMHCPGSLDVTAGGRTETLETPFEQGLQFEIEEVHRCLAAGLGESPVMPLDESLALAMTMDEIRAQLGVVYPGE